jgi:transcriptional regulator GlxA family with amidase domain
MNRLRTGILIFPEVEVLDFTGPFEVFSVTRLNEERRREEPSPFEVFLVAQSREPVTTTGGMCLMPDYDFISCPQPLELLVVPGGWGTRQEVHNAELIGWVQKQAQSAQFLTSVCTGSFLLAQAGLLPGRRATTHWKSLDRMRDSYPDVTVLRDKHVVHDGNTITSAGISAGIDMALQVVARIYGEVVARATARHMEYRYPETNERRIAL